MWKRLNPLLLASSLLDVAFAVNIFASHYDGTINVLTLTASDGGYDLRLNNSLNVGGQPSWMTFDPSGRTIFSSDETGFGSAAITAVTVTADGNLTLIGKEEAPLGGVSNALYGEAYAAHAHYGTSQVSTYRLPIGTGNGPMQTFELTMDGTGTIPSRQDAAHPHQVLVDPSGNFILVPDLGADQIRIWRIDQSSGELIDCPSYVEDGGTGPRHGVFYGNDTLYVGNELSNTIHSFQVTYPSDGCVTLSKNQVITTFDGNQTAPSGNKVGEVRIKDNYLYASNRRDLSFDPNDSIASFSLSDSGEMTFQQITSSGGTYPRTFAINDAGDLVVIGDQTTANVVIVERDPATGLLGAQIADLRIGDTGHAESDDGLSAVLWDE